MPSFSNPKIIIGLFLLVGAGFVFTLTREPLATETYESIQDSDAHITPKNDFYAEAERRREDKLEERAQQERQEKLQKARENSVECQFWRQQKNEKSTERVDEKIAEFCSV